MPTPTLANLRGQLTAAENQSRRVIAQLYTDPTSPYYTNPRRNPLFAVMVNLNTRVIPNLRRRITRREEANRARSAARRAKERRVARSVVAKWRARSMRPPNVSAFGNAGGTTYRRHAAAVASPTLSRIMKQLEKLRELNKNKNKFHTRAQMVELYENMQNKMGRASNWKTAASVVNKAQAIMFKAGLL